MRYFVLVLVFISNAHAASLKIGCAYTCDRSTTESLHQAAKAQSHTLTLVDLSNGTEMNWNELHGVVIPGGEDIDPKYYIGVVEPELQERIRNLDHLVDYSEVGKSRDAFEYALLKHYYQDPALRNFPLLGICRGMQIMTVALGIPLFVDIKTEVGIDNRRNLYDNIQVESGSLLAILFPETSFDSYKYHHQGLRVPYYLEHMDRWPNVKVTAYSNDGKIAEGLELQDRPALGIQFHPEADDTSVRHRIFGWLVNKAFVRLKEPTY